MDCITEAVSFADNLCGWEVKQLLFDWHVWVIFIKAFCNSSNVMILKFEYVLIFVGAEWEAVASRIFARSCSR